MLWQIFQNLNIQIQNIDNDMYLYAIVIIHVSYWTICDIMMSLSSESKCEWI